MPTRIIREGILTSEPINSLSPTAELFYRRLMSVADDYGRFHANPVLLRAACYPLQLDKISDSHVQQMLSECAKAGCIVFYNQNRNILIPKFGQQCRSRSKFPEPSQDEVLIKREATVNHLRSESESETKSKTETKPESKSHTQSESGPEAVERVLALATKTAETVRATPPPGAAMQLQKILNTLYSRPETQRWTCAEEMGLVEIVRRQDWLAEAELLVRFRRRMPEEEKRFFPQSVAKLLEKWDETLDRARTKVAPIKSSTPKTFIPSDAKKFEHSPELGKKFREAAGEEMKKNE